MEPFAALRVLSLAQNRIAAAEDVMEAARWPALRELHLWGNPLTQRRTSLPVALQLAFVDARGIQIVRTRPRAPVRPPPLVRGADLHVVDTRPPVAPPLPATLHAHEQRYLEFTTSRPATRPLLPALTHDDSDQPDDAGPHGPGVFLTQNDDADLSLPPLRPASLPDVSRTAAPGWPSAPRRASATIAEADEAPGSSTVNRLAIRPYAVPPHVAAILLQHPEFSELYAQDDDEAGDQGADTSGRPALDAVPHAEAGPAQAVRSLRQALNRPPDTDTALSPARLAFLSRPKVPPRSTSACAHSRAQGQEDRASKLELSKKRRLQQLQEVLDALRRRTDETRADLGEAHYAPASHRSPTLADTSFPSAT